MRFFARMNLSEARSLIQASLERMRGAYGAVVFDEWALVGTAAKHGGVLAYTGPRIESFRQRFSADVDLLRGAAAGQPPTVGDFLFALEAEGPRHDALLRVGAGSFLVEVLRVPSRSVDTPVCEDSRVDRCLCIVACQSADLPIYFAKSMRS